VKRLVTILVAGALAVPAVASADRVELRGTGGAPFVSFTAKFVGDEVAKVTKFKFFDIVLLCDGDLTLVVDNDRSPLPAMKVKDDEFGDRFTSNNGQKVKVEGKFSKGGKVAEGTLRIKGDFTDPNGQALTNCDSGKVKWTAK
jgi:hypothetical protein